MPEKTSASEQRAGAPALKPLKEQVIVITGASSGIGLATARAAARAGAKVVAAARSQEAIESLERELTRSGAEAMGVVCDVSKEEDVHRLARVAVDRFGGFDTWVNNAGVSIYGRIEEVALADMRQLFETNFWGVVYGSRVALEHLKERGGALINLGSALSERSIPLQGIYSASKFAVRGFTDALRMEVEKAGYPVSVTLIKPAAIDTPYVQHAKNYMDEAPKNPPPVYAPEVVVDTILRAATHPERDLYAGSASAGFALMEKIMPRATDRGMEATLFDVQKSGRPAGPIEDHSLYEPSEPELRERGGYPGKVFEHSPYTWMQTAPGALGLALIGASLVAATVAVTKRSA